MASAETMSPLRPDIEDGPSPEAKSRSPPASDHSPSPRPGSSAPAHSPSSRAGSALQAHDRSPSAGAVSPSPARDRSPSPARARSPPPYRDRSPPRREPRRRSPPPPAPAKSEEDKLASARAEYNKLLELRSQGVYLPPAKLRALQAAITDKSSKEYQRMHWDALKKSINGLVNKVNSGNIKFVIPELFGENLIRGRGLLCQSLLKAQHASLPFTPIFCCLVAICNTKLPQVGELLVKRLVMRFRKAFKRNDKPVCVSTVTFIAHLVNFQVVHETIAAQILLLLLQRPTDDSVEIAVGLMREVGLFLEEMSPAIANAVFDRFRQILHEADIERRTQYMIEVLFQVRKDRYKDNPIIKEELDLVEEDDQITHRIGLDDDIDVQDGLNIFKMDPDWEANEEEYKKLKAEILGEGSDDEDDDEDESGSESEEENEEQKALEIKDQTNADLVNLRRTIYLSIQSSADPEEAAHKLMRLKLPAGQEPELVSMIVESCAQEKVYLKFMGLLGERFARLNRMWTELFEESFVKYYTTIHRYETNKLRNIARFFGYLLASDSIGWHVLSAIHLNEEETTSASRIFVKILFEDLQENMGIAKLKTRLGEEVLRPSLEGLFPHDDPKHIRFSINYFTSIKMGYLTEEMREFLANMPKPALPAPPKDDSDSDSVSSYSSYTGSSYSSRSRSRSPRRAASRGRSLSRSPARRIKDRSYSRDRSYTRSVSTRRSISRSVSPRRGASRRVDSRSLSRSASPPRRRARPDNRDRSYSRSVTRSRSRSRSRSPLPVRRGRSLTRSRSRSRSPSYSRSRSPLPIRERSPLPNSATAATRRRRADSYSLSPSPPPQKRRRNSSSSISAVGAAPQRRTLNRYDDSRSRSPSRGWGRSRSLSRSRSPPPRPAATTRGGRGGRYHDRGGDGHGRVPSSVSPPRRQSRSPAGCRGPPPPLVGDRCAGGRRDYSPSRSPSPSPRQVRGGKQRDDRFRSRSPLPRSRSPVAGGSGGGNNKRRRHYSSSRSRSRSPIPPAAKRGRVAS
ncbi:MIF4G domain-containing protein [Apodospora peruviana]|uniref:Pre-mRNA-splicing factor CWC22 n=1 Tax=Apodospora peruviana TaxID=516989 RepID=A0AAE0M883_9PEZI|nr:MIF4G domain-containing protein [Apodospora peruviana]